MHRKGLGSPQFIYVPVDSDELVELKFATTKSEQNQQKNPRRSFLQIKMTYNRNTTIAGFTIAGTTIAGSQLPVVTIAGCTIAGSTIAGCTV